ncbi:lysophospholipid acyltransferase [Orbilia ellipsospora]|uniref:Lysophospholipid acyltransferase n=1 Tax=Orbilia ellipsospora TaxID=2528407 RepID=A0AAV9XIL5_9PEZI
MIQLIHDQFLHFSQLAGGIAPDYLKLIFVVLLSYPLAGILKRIPESQPAAKNLFLIGTSLFYFVGVFDLWTGIRTVMISSAGAYLIAKYVKGPLMPWIGFVFIMGHMAVSHIARQRRGDDSTVDITGVQMVLVMKLTAFCWNVWDGKFPDSELSAVQQDRAIREMPSVLDYAGYVLFFPSVMVGPAFDYNEYKKWLDLSMFDVEVTDKKGAVRKRRRIPRSGRMATRKAVVGLIWIGLFVKASSMFTVEFALSDGFLNYSILHRVWYIYWLMFGARLKYYGIWSLTEGACILAGLGYNGLDENKRIRWDRVTNIDAWELETAQNSRGVLEAWNKNTNKWLRNYIYLRVTPKGKKPGFRSSMATFVTSAFWHGFYPGYYLAFVTASLVQTVAKFSRRYLRPFFLSPDGTKPTKYKRYYDVFGAVVTQAALAYMTLPFIVLDFNDSIRLWSRVWFYTHVGIITMYAIFKSPAVGLLQAELKRRTNVTPVQPSKEQLQRELRKEAPPFGIPDEDLVVTDVNEAFAEIKELKQRQAAGESPLQAFRNAKAHVKKQS